MAERLLIVDDEATLCDSLRRVFERDGYEVATAGRAEEALQLFEEGAFDLILSDILLPGMDGIEFLEAVKKQAPDQIVIVMTAYASIETAVGALRAGAHDYILKPVIHEEIKRLVRLALNARSGEKSGHRGPDRTGQEDRRFAEQRLCPGGNRDRQGAVHPGRPP
jgi:DNA-binding NtrC family response regulator